MAYSQFDRVVLTFSNANLICPPAHTTLPAQPASQPGGPVMSSPVPHSFNSLNTGNHERNMQIQARVQDDKENLHLRPSPWLHRASEYATRYWQYSFPGSANHKTDSRPSVQYLLTYSWGYAVLLIRRFFGRGLTRDDLYGFLDLSTINSSFGFLALDLRVSHSQKPRRIGGGGGGPLAI